MRLSCSSFSGKEHSFISRRTNTSLQASHGALPRNQEKSMTAKSPNSTPVNRKAVQRITGAEAKKGGGQYTAGTAAARIDAAYQQKGGGRHVKPAPDTKKP
jgi:hypothetical protein